MNLLVAKDQLSRAPLYEWTQTEAAQYIQQQQPYNYLELLKECHRLGPNDHCSRAFYGMYQNGFIRI